MEIQSGVAIILLGISAANCEVCPQTCLFGHDGVSCVSACVNVIICNIIICTIIIFSSAVYQKWFFERQAIYIKILITQYFSILCRMLT